MYAVIIINLFFVPTLPVYLSCKNRGQPVSPSLELLFQYCIAVCLNHVAAHVITLFILKLTGINFPLDSARYTLAALLAALLLLLAHISLKYLKPEIHVSENKRDREDETHEIP